MKGMDICYHQGDIDFQKAHDDGIDFILPRDGWGTQKIDPKFVEYVQSAQNARISVPGVYHFIYALNLQQAIENANRAIKNVEAAGLPQSTIIWCDLEYDTVENARRQGVILTSKDQRDFAEAFCNYCLAQGYPSGIYCNKDYIVNVYGQDIMNKYDIWLADLVGKTDYPCVYRQYDWYGRPAGCPVNVDLDEYIGQYTAGTAKPKTGCNNDYCEIGGDKNMIKASELLKQIHDVVDNIPTVYEQGAQWGAWNGSAFRLDCIIFVKCMVYWDWYYPSKTAAHGGAQYDPSYDWTEINILNHCKNVAYDGFLAAKPCEYLYMDGHGGFKIDEFTRNGKTYNAAECTWAAAWGTPAKCVYSYVGDDGSRYNYKGGIRNGSWTAHGELYGVDYSGEIMPEPEPAEVTIPVNKFVYLLPTIQKGDTGSAVKILQNCLAVLGYYTDAVDGSAGPNTSKAIKAYQTDAGLSSDGVFGLKSWTKLLIG